jgi:glycyl-tRNA synthetase beta chain
MSTRDLLLEIGTEELPPIHLKQLATALSQALQSEIAKVGLVHGEVKFFATPRRLAIYIQALDTRQKGHVVEKRGPALNAAFDAQGHPTLACLGFANSCGVTVEDLLQQKTDKGAWLYYRSEQPGKITTELLPNLVNQALSQLPMAKPMRWGEQAVEFIRPVHWVVLLFGNEVINTTVLGVYTSRQTYGHRFHHSGGIDIAKASDYASLLQQQGYVIADYDARKQLIREQIAQVVVNKGQAVVDEALLDEVTSLVEWPVVLLGAFDAKYLEIPPEVIMTAMKTHQKYFSVVDAQGKLLPYFIIVSNIASLDPARVIAGNQRVIHARLSDAQFFYHSDLKHRLEYRLEELKTVIFHKKLGSLFDKALRISVLAGFIAQELCDVMKASHRAGILAKADLMTAMVGEFPELQGIMGYYYAKQDGETEDVARAIGQHYQPRFAKDALPDSLLGCYVSMADKMDTVVGLFAAQQPPTGEKDPFGLRRAALGVLRILIEKQLPLNLLTLLEKAMEQYPAHLARAEVVSQTLVFMLERLRAWYLDRGIAAEVFNAVMARNPQQPLDIHRRIEAVQYFQTLPEAKSLTAANKRVSRILRDQSGDWSHHPVNPSLFEYNAEHQLLTLMEEKSKEVDSLSLEANYSAILSSLSSLQKPIDHFFDEVMVMVENENIRTNRLSLLHELQQLFLQVADISLLS